MSELNPDLINQWVSQALKPLKTLKVDLTGTSGKGDGYIGNVAFVTAVLQDENGKKTSQELVIKYGKTGDKLREDLPIRQSFEREIFFYAQAVKLFESINKRILDEFITPCYGTLLLDKQEVLVLQNLKSIGYDLHNKDKPMDLNHITLTLENYGKFHAFSLAMLHQNAARFGDLQCLLSIWLRQVGGMYSKMQEVLYETLELMGEQELLGRLKKRFVKSFPDVMEEMLHMQESKLVLLHGDCWNNNFMFKYSDNHQPVSCKFLDFQMSKLASPALDLSYHLFSTTDEQFDNFQQLMKIYHNSLCQTLKIFDVPQLFSYEDLITHWKKYSVFGFILGIMIVMLSSADKEDSMDINDVKNENVDKIFDNIRKTRYRFSDRIVSVTKHFLRLEL